jgi:glycine/D-amino acid oxidase-like deaminating enzyme
MRRPIGTGRPERDILPLPVRGQLDQTKPPKATWPPVPDLFDVITYFRARGDSFALIASIGFWVGDDPKRARTARGLKLWYEAELERRAAAKAAIR